MADRKHYLIRLGGEITLKRTRARTTFQRRLKRNLKDAFSSAGHTCQIRQRQARIELSTTADDAEAVAARVFGVQSVSRAETRDFESLDELARQAVELFAGQVAGRTFRVRARRQGPRREAVASTPEIERTLGTALAPFAAGVDLRSPQITVRLELSGGRAQLFTTERPGPGGLPVGTQGRALVLGSGGFDSAVAAWRMLRRGVAVDYVFFNLAGPVHEIGAVRVFEQLAQRWSYGSRPRLAAVDLRPFVSELERVSRPSFRQVLLKRAMLRAAEQLAIERERVALITGDAVGQVSSQTLQNLAVCSRAVELSILRPLVSENKETIVAEARAIGTFPLSAAVREVCGLVPGQVETRARLEDVEGEERLLDPTLIDRAVAARRTYDLRHLEPDRLRLAELELDAAPPDATVIDLRPRDAFEQGHHPGALHLEYSRALDAYRSFDRRGRYVVYCEVGLKSAQLADLMRRDGFRAWHLPPQHVLPHRTPPRS